MIAATTARSEANAYLRELWYTGNIKECIEPSEGTQSGMLFMCQMHVRYWDHRGLTSCPR